VRKASLLAVATLCAAGAAFAALGDVAGSFPIPGGGQAGLGISDSYLYVCNYSASRISLAHPTTGSIYRSFTAAGGTNTRGLAYQSGGYLWQNKAYTVPYTIYRTNHLTGSIYNSYALPTNITHGSAPLATGDGGVGTSYIILSSYGTPNSTVYYMTTTGSIARSHTANTLLYDIAYDWRNKLVWGGQNDGYVYGFTTTGSRVTSFRKPTGNVYGIAYYGEYLWVAGTTGYVYRQHCPNNLGVTPTSMGKIKGMFR
jgi:hypothetical protein